MSRSSNDVDQMAAALRLYANHSDSHAQKNLRVGTRLDKYRLLKRLGSGGFATVYSAMDELEHRRVALKIPSDTFTGNVASQADLTREIRIMARLEHPNILRLKDARVIDGKLVMVFPLGEETLADRLTKRISRPQAIDFTTQIIEAVAYAHEHHVLHRDIKPENFILFAHNHLCLTDFGIARFGDSLHSQSGSGTLGYVAPEQAMGKATYRSDVFSLGLVLYRMFSGSLPEYPFTPPLPGYTKLRKGLTAPFVELIRKCIDPQPTRRFRDGVALHNAFKQIRTTTNLRVR